MSTPNFRFNYARFGWNDVAGLTRNVRIRRYDSVLLRNCLPIAALVLISFRCPIISDIIETAVYVFVIKCPRSAKRIGIAKCLLHPLALRPDRLARGLIFYYEVRFAAAVVCIYDDISKSRLVFAEGPVPPS